jgi:uncharacterized membrane protein YphA (DoxX/SURF4 family)
MVKQARSSRGVDSIVAFFRISLGSLFIYSGLFKVLNPAVFENALKAYNIFPDKLAEFVLIVFPFVEIILGILLVLRVFIGIVGSITIILLMFFVIIAIVGVFKGSGDGCGCFSASFFLNFHDPTKIVIRDLILAVFAILVFMHRRDTIRAEKILCAAMFFVPLSLSFVLIGKRANENKLYSSYLENRKAIMDTVAGIGIDHINVNEIMEIGDIKKVDDKSCILLFIISAFDCNTCIDEALYVDYLTSKYREKLKTIAVVGRIGHTAINDFVNRYRITYTVVQETNATLKKLVGMNTLKILANADGIVINVDPPTFRSRKLRDEYERMLAGYLKEVM